MQTTEDRPLDSILFQGEGSTIGGFRCPADDPRFADSGPIQAHIFVFPRTSVTITHDGSDPVVADPNNVMFYNRDQLYRRGPIHPAGDRCDWFRVDDVALRDAIRRFDPSVDDRPDRPYPFRRGPSRSDLYLRQRKLFDYLSRETDPDPLWVEESLLELLGEVVAAAFRCRSGARPVSAETRATHRALAREAQRILAEGFREPWTLAALARALQSSPFHLSRVFRRCTGWTVHGYVDQLRLRAALDELRDPQRDLTELAFELGYSSHSHFSYAFRRAFGSPPSHLRRRARI